MFPTDPALNLVVFYQIVIDEANWVTLAEDLKDMERKPVAGFDAVFCLGNSFSHLLDLEGTLVSSLRQIFSTLQI